MAQAGRRSAHQSDAPQRAGAQRPAVSLHAILPQIIDDAAYAAWRRSQGTKLGDYLYDWTFWRRQDQTPPEGDWRCWLILAGRGFGKTRTGAEWVRAQAETRPGLRIALVAATLADARAIMVEGESGLMTLTPPDRPLTFEPSLRRLIWPNGAMATLYSAAEPEGLRGPEHHIAWADECAKWDNGLPTWDNLALSLRLGRQPQIVATTTPRPVPLVRRIMADAGTITTRGRMADNALNLPQSFVATMTGIYGGTRIGRQELDGELIADLDGALWTRALIEAAQAAQAALPPPPMLRIVIGVDPPAGTQGDACGILVVGRDASGDGWVLEDASLSGATPEGWAKKVAQMAAHWRADRVVAEANNGGLMVDSVLRAVSPHLPLRLVRAAHGKVARAEPVAALYEQGRIHHARPLTALEDELCGLAIGGAYHGPGRSPDRADALVWALTDLMLARPIGAPRIRPL